jgi:putative oxidoreductase
MKLMRKKAGTNGDLGLLLLRGTVGGLLMGHGAQKLFGVWGGHGLAGTSGWMESMGFRPGKPWALMASLGEFGGGLLTALGLLTPTGSMGIAGSMAMAAAKVHSGKPIWVTEGGAEFTLTNLAAVTALALAGPGRYSLDHALGIKLPRWVGPLGALGTAAVVGYGLYSSRPQPQPAATAQPAAETHITAPLYAPEEPADLPALATPADPARLDLNDSFQTEYPLGAIDNRPYEDFGAQ